MNDISANRADELGGFLRGRRESLRPSDVGLPARHRPPRTPGLRREEVAELAGISVDYIIRLEQARGLRPSVQVVEALAQALRLEPPERLYLFDLTQQRPRSAPPAEATVSPMLVELVDDLSPRPVMVTNHRYDILVWNVEMAALFPTIANHPREERNAMRLCLLNDQALELYEDRAAIIRDGVAHLRAAWASHPDDDALAQLIEDCITENDDVALAWIQQDIDVKGRGTKKINHPQLGPLDVAFELMTPIENPDHRLLLFRGADEQTRRAFDRVAAGQ